MTNIDRVPRLRPDLFKAAGDRRGLSPGRRLQKKGEFVARLRNRIKDGSFATDLLKRAGVVSLSKNALNILMWSHYADYHRGFVLEFRIPTKGVKRDLVLSTDRLLPFPVTYQVGRPRIDIGSYAQETLLHKILLTKSTNWEYEEEERVIDENRPPGVFKYRRDEILCSVIAGMRMSSDNFGSGHSLCQTLANSSIPTLNLYRAAPNPETYELHVPNHPRLARTAASAKCDDNSTEEHPTSPSTGRRVKRGGASR